jgi:hypothetical protein
VALTAITMPPGNVSSRRLPRCGYTSDHMNARQRWFVTRTRRNTSVCQSVAPPVSVAREPPDGERTRTEFGAINDMAIEPASKRSRQAAHDPAQRRRHRASLLHRVRTLAQQ